MSQMRIRSRSVARVAMFIGLVMVLAVVASAQVTAPPPPDEPAIYISSNFVADDGPVKVVQDVTIDVAGVFNHRPHGQNAWGRADYPAERHHYDQ